MIKVSSPGNCIQDEVFLSVLVMLVMLLKFVLSVLDLQMLLKKYLGEEVVQTFFLYS